MLKIEIIRFEAQDIVTASCICTKECKVYGSGVQHGDCNNTCQALQHYNAEHSDTWSPED